MLYVIGGAPRSGKSIIARKFAKEKGISYFSLDTLTSVVQDGLPSLEIKHGHPYIPKAEKLWPLVKPMLEHIESHEENYVVEGDMLLPRMTKSFLDEHPGSVRVCFVGFTEISAQDKLQEIRQHSSFKDNWTSEYNDPELLLKVEGMIEFSKFLQQESVRFGLRYFDLSRNFEKRADGVYSYLISG